MSSALFLDISLYALDVCSEPLFSASKGVLTNYTNVDDIVVGRNTDAELNQLLKLIRSAARKTM